MELTGVIERIELGIVIQDASTRILFANQQARDLLGLDEAQLLERNSLDARWSVVRPDGTPFDLQQLPVPTAVRERREVRGVLMGVYRARYDDRVWVIVNALPSFHADGSVKDVICTLTNISHEHAGKRELQELNVALAHAVETRTVELSRAIDALKESESNYRAVIRAMAEGVAVHAADGSITAANPAAEHILGLTLAQMQNRHPVDPAWLLSKADGSPLSSDEIPSEITRKTGTPCRNVQLRVQRGNGQRAWLSVNTDPIRLPTGDAPTGVVATFTDITAEHNALLALESSRSSVQHFIQAVPGALFEGVVRPDGTETIRFMSPQISEMFGVTETEALHSSGALWSRLHPDDMERARRERDDALRQRRELDVELRIGSAREGWKWVRVRSSLPESTDEGLVVRHIVLDVTEQRRMAQSLRDAQRQEAMGVLAAGIAHNFNNMLAVILPSLERLRADVPEPMRAEAEDSFQAATQAAELVRQLMQLARSETAGRIDTVDLCALSRDVIQMCRRTFDRRIDIQLEAPEQPLLVSGRRSELQQAVLNLCINARDAVEHVNQPWIDVRLTQDGTSATIAVADNGVGMSDETKQRLGEPFFTTKPPGRGTGLGTASAVGIVREVGGTMSWSSTLGQGSRFEIVLPLASNRTDLDSQVAMPRQGGMLAGHRVLVIDDEPLVLRTAERHLRALGADVLLADGGVDGLEQLAERSDVTLVLLDLSMPAMHGEEVLRRIREHSTSLPVLILSGWVANPEALSAASGVISKPFTQESLRHALAPLVERLGTPLQPR